MVGNSLVPETLHTVDLGHKATVLQVYCVHQSLPEGLSYGLQQEAIGELCEELHDQLVSILRYGLPHVKIPEHSIRIFGFKATRHESPDKSYFEWNYKGLN
jgi:hypothetical protein